MLDISSMPTSIDLCGADDLANIMTIFQQMETKLEQKYHTHVGNVDVLQKLANCKRKLGKLDEAVELYSILLKQQPNNLMVKYILAALQGRLEEIRDVPLGVKPAPLVKCPYFLSEALQQSIWDDINNQSQFVPAKVTLAGKGCHDSTMRNNADFNGKFAIQTIIRKKIAVRLESLRRGLGVVPFERAVIEVNLRRYRHGEYFRTHHDGDGRRMITFVYFLFTQPKAFEGGDLVVFDSDPTTATYSDHFTRIIPENNTIIFFPSHYYHAVLPVINQSEQLLSSRFVINGHIQQG